MPVKGGGLPATALNPENVKSGVVIGPTTGTCRVVHTRSTGGVTMASAPSVKNHSTTTETELKRFTFPAGISGTYILKYYFTTSGSGGSNTIRVYKNGVQFHEFTPMTPYSRNYNQTDSFTAEKNDVISLRVMAASGATVTIDTVTLNADALPTISIID